jgi:hypothetical protein
MKCTPSSKNLYPGESIQERNGGICFFEKNYPELIMREGWHEHMNRAGS